MEVIKLNARSRDIAESTLNLYLDQCKNSTLMRSQRALVIDGKTLLYVLDKRANIQHLFLELTRMCSSVLACRATPLQKAYLVRIVKEQLMMQVSKLSCLELPLVWHTSSCVCVLNKNMCYDTII